MTRLLLASTLAGVLLVGLLAWSLRGEVAQAAEIAPVREETQADVLEAATRGCVAGGGTAWMGREGNVMVFRCRPWLNLGISK